MRVGSEGDLVERIYDTALQPENWPFLLAELADVAGGSSAWLSRLDVRTGVGAGVIARIDPKMPTLYRDYYGSINPIARAEDPQRFMSQWRPGVLTDEDRMSKADLMKSEFYADFLRPQDVHSTMMVRLAARGTETSVINIHRNDRQEQFQAREIDALLRLHPHLVRALRLTDRFESAASLTRGVSSVLDRSRDGMIILDGRGRLVHANAVAERLLSEHRGLGVSGGFLRADRVQDDRALQDLIASAAQPQGKHGGSMRLSFAADETPLALMVSPVQPGRIPVFQNGPSVLVCITGFASANRVPDEVLKGLFGLTSAESRVAASLLEGLNPAEVAAELGLSVHTVRVHLARIYAKTQTRRQSELVGLLMRSIGGGWN